MAQNTLIETFFNQPNTASSFPRSFLKVLLAQCIEISLIKEDSPEEKAKTITVLRTTETVASEDKTVVKMYLNFEPTEGRVKFLEKLNAALVEKFNDKEKDCLKEESIIIFFPQK
jgi:hypothetical protein